MQRQITCCDCGTQVPLPLKLRTVSCRRCGTVYYVNDSHTDARKEYPSLTMRPIDTVAADGCQQVSKWMLPWTRPVVPGWYETRFNHIEPVVLRLYWDGKRFVSPELQPVAMCNFRTWRGMLA